LNRHVYSEGSGLCFGEERKEAREYNQAELREEATHFFKVVMRENEGREN
jgi:hypothetical protein